MIVILTSISSGSNVHNLASLKSKSQPTTMKIDWKFKTAIKVDEDDENKIQQIFYNNESIPEIILYGSEDYQYPLLVDMPDLVERVKTNKNISVQPINNGNFSYLIENRNLCNLQRTNESHLDLLILIKSAPGNFIARDTIRSTWGKHVCWGGRVVRRVFLLGAMSDKNKLFQNHIDMEQEVYSDIVQQGFIDHYYNNTLKMMLGLKWATQHCSDARFIMFVDDDYFVHPRIVLAYLESLSQSLYSRLVSGYVWRSATPQRNSRTKWFVSKQDYPWPFYPPYCSAGNFFLSMNMAIDISIAMKYTQYLRFDDVFLGIVLHKLLVVPMHLTNVFSFNPIVKTSENYKQMISSHGYKNPKHILETWIDLNCTAFCK